MARFVRGSIFFFCVTLLSILVCAPAGKAQDQYRILLSSIETDAFPRISLYMGVYDQQGGFIHNLKPEHVTILEDNTDIPICEMNLLYPGAQVVVAITPGSTFGIRDARGSSRYDYIVSALQKWVEGHKASNPDDLSLLITNGPEVTHLENADAWLSTLQGFKPEGFEITPSLDTLGRALEIASDRARRPGMGRAILWITAPLQQDLLTALQGLITRYNQQGIRLFIWLVASAEQFLTPSAKQLAELATQSGGAFFAFSGSETIPSLEEYLEPLRNVYFLSYNSRITTSGVHQVAIQVRTGEFQISSDPLEFEITVLPPNIAFISPPTRIQRTAPEEQSENVNGLMPTSQSLEVLIEFPDGHERPLKRTILYVDGNIADENTIVPFDRFTWDLSAYTEAGSHTLRAEVTDALGLTNTSVEHNVLIAVNRPQSSFITTVSRNRALLAVLAVILSGAILIWVLVLGGRIQPSNAPRRKPRLKQRSTDPVTQPVQIKSVPTTPRLPTWLNRLHWAQRPSAPKVYAYLTRVVDSPQTMDITPLAITKDEITIGSDPTKAMFVLNHPTVDSLHARLIRLQDGSFKLQDEGSTAGTWINYMPVPVEGASLQDGDLIHFGGLLFRFSIPHPTYSRKPTIRIEEPLL